MKYGIILLLLFLTCDVAVASEHRCSADAAERARKLLEFHVGKDDRMGFETPRVVAPMKNPENRKQNFDVLEVWGYIYNGRYRMRFIYYILPRGCLLMGEEILQHANL